MKIDRVKLLSLWPLLLPLIILLRNPTGFPYPNADGLYSDISISHYPNIMYLKNALSEFGIIPLWSPLIYSGTPFAANPLSGLWYPPGWFALFFPLPLGINLTTGIHLLWGGIGLYCLLMGSGLSHRSSIFGGLVFMCSPKIFAHYGAGHLTLIYALCWTPWLLLAEKCSDKKGLFPSIFPSIILALIFLADPRWAVYAGVVWVLYVISYGRIGLLKFGKKPSKSDNPQILQEPNSLVRGVLGLGFQTLTAAFLSSPLLFPLLEYTRLSTRSMIKPEEATIFSLPFTRILGYLFPDYGGNHEWTLYLGCVVFVLLLVSFTRTGKKSDERFWMWLGFLALIVSFGDNIPGYHVLNSLPGFRLLRVPSRALFLTGISAAIVSAHVMDDFFQLGGIKPRRRILLTLTALAALSIMMAAGVWVITRENSVQFLFGSGLTLVTTLLIGARFRSKLSPMTLYLVLVALALVDWGIFNTSVLSYKTKQEVLTEKILVLEYLTDRGDDFRVYTPSYSLPQQATVQYGIEMVSGVDPLSLASYAEFMDDATGVPPQGYSVTIPPLRGGEPQQDNVEYLPNSKLLGLLNTGYVVSEFDLVVEGLELDAVFGNTRVYRNLNVLPRSWIQPVGSITGEQIKPVTNTLWRPNRIGVTTSGPGLLVLSEIAYPGWRVKVDEKAAEIQKVNEILRGVRLDDGDHDVVFYYRPVSVYMGLGGFLLGFILVGVSLWANKERIPKWES